MSDYFLGEIRIVPFNFAPKNWAFCNGQLLPINQNQALFSLFGTTYGGNGSTNFALPNLRGRVPIHVGNGHTQGEAGGTSSHTLTISQLPAHIHFAQGVNANALLSLAGVTPGPTKALAQAVASLPGNATAPVQIYGNGQLSATMRADALTNTGGSQPHQNMMPFLSLNYIVALTSGIFPSPN